MPQIKRTLLLLLIFIAASLALKAQQQAVKNDVIINIMGTTHSDSISLSFTMNILRKNDSIKLVSSKVDMLTKAQINSDYPPFIMHRGNKYKKELNTDGSFKQYAFYDDRSVLLKPHVKAGKDSIFYMICIKLIDSIARTRKEILEQVHPQNNLPYSLDDGKPQITYEIITPSETKIINLNYPASVSPSLLFSLFAAIYAVEH